MKLLIVAFNDRNTLPYVENYINILNDNKIDFDCIFWDRYKNARMKKLGNIYTLSIICFPGSNKISKIIPMIKYKYYVSKLIKKNKYTHLVVLGTQPGILLYSIIKNNFSNRFIFDYRDYTYEKLSVYKKLVEDLINHSYFTSISSYGFLKYLKRNDKIIPCHNFSGLYKDFYTIEHLKNKNEISIGFVGGVRYFNANKMLLERLKNNSRFKLYYVGRVNVDCDLEGYSKKHNINNVIFKGEYNNNDKPKIYQDIDLINAIYGSESLEVTTALPNRLYDGLLYKKPIIASKGTYLGEIVDKYNIGISIDVSSDDVCQELEEYLAKFDEKVFLINRKALLERIIKEQTVYLNRIREFIINSK